STLEEKVAARYGVSPEKVFWVSEIESKWKGSVRVKALPPPGRDDNLVWMVDLVRWNVVPLSPEAKEISSWQQKPKNVP
ncbi:MAG TPA: hypothetical protein DF383_00645, partial [Deltaproteobacteria bacterium]|nr:hypothetical protein [Deltaproteobacteria bacterium]